MRHLIIAAQPGYAGPTSGRRSIRGHDDHHRDDRKQQRPKGRVNASKAPVVRKPAPLPAASGAGGADYDQRGRVALFTAEPVPSRPRFPTVGRHGDVAHPAPVERKVKTSAFSCLPSTTRVKPA